MIYYKEIFGLIVGTGSILFVCYCFKDKLIKAKRDVEESRNSLLGKKNMEIDEKWKQKE